ncbi:MAG TPA: carbon storage regulator CsrA [Spirochaetales bacterium]|nr:carbon storage regulator CsrA [Spirochaetales bacterium]HOV39586.1 carbon storage regulator CsrA [Spirochaetales bacterium]
MLILSRRSNESIMIGDSIEISVVDIKGDQVKLGIRAPKKVKVYRKEVYESIQRENKEAVLSKGELPSLDSYFNSKHKPGNRSDADKG